MKFNIIGTGKTGQFVRKFLSPHQIAGVFNSRNPVTPDALKQGQASIIFVDGPTMEDLIPSLLEARQFVVTGSTAVSWPADLDAQLKALNLCWIRGSNFSVLMNTFFYMVRKMKPLYEMLAEPNASLYELHHVTKKDKPSGTALKLRELLEWPHVDIEAERKEECPGIHSLSLQKDQESFEMKHVSTGREVYAQGAVWAAKTFLENSVSGLLNFEDLMYEKFNELNAR